MKKILLVASAALALAGCDMIAGLVGADEYEKNGSTTNRSRTAGGDDGLISNLQPVGPAPGQTPPDQVPPDGQTGDQTGQPVPPEGPTGPPDVTTGGGFDSSMLVGRWGDNGNCAQVIEFFANGTFQAPNGGRGNWRLVGDRLTLSAGSRNVSWRVQSISAQRIVARDSSGQMTMSIRC